MSEDTTAKRAGRRRRTTRGGRRRSLRVPGAPVRESWPVGSESPSVAPPGEDELEAELENATTDEFGAMKLELDDGIDDTGKTAEMHVQFPLQPALPAPQVPDEEKTQPRYRLEDRFESFEPEPIEQDADELTNPRIRVAGLGAPTESAATAEQAQPSVVVRSSVVIAPSRIIGVAQSSESSEYAPPAPRPSAPPRDSLPAGVGSSQSRPPPRIEAAPAGAGTSAYVAHSSAPPLSVPPPAAAVVPAPAIAPALVAPAPPLAPAAVAPPALAPGAPSAPAVAPPAVAPAPARVPAVPNVSPLGLNVPNPPAAAIDGAPTGASDPDDAELFDVDDAEAAEPEDPRKELRSPPPPPPVSRAAPPAPPPVAAQPPAAAPAAAPTTTAAPVAAKRPPPPPTSAKQDEDRQKRKQVRQWWERFFSDDYLMTVPPPTPAQIAKQVDFVEASLGLAKGASVLDVGCGLGLHAIELARRGYLVVAIDLSLAMITRAAEAAQQHNLKVSFIHADIREMEFDGAFDAVICLGTTFGFFDDDANRDVLARMQHGLKPGGRLLIDVVNRDCVIKSQPNLVWFEGDECVCMEESEFNYFNSRLSVKRTMMREDGRQNNAEYSMRLYSLHELGQLVQTMGFRVIEVSGQEATRGTFFGSYAPRILMLAERRSAAARPTATGMAPERGSAEMARPSFTLPGAGNATESPARPSAAFPQERATLDLPKPPKPE